MKTLLSTALTLILLTACSTDSGEQSQYVSVDGERYEVTDYTPFQNQYMLTFDGATMVITDSGYRVEGAGNILILVPGNTPDALWAYYEKGFKGRDNYQSGSISENSSAVDFNITTQSGRTITGNWDFSK